MSFPIKSSSLAENILNYQVLAHSRAKWQILRRSMSSHHLRYRKVLKPEIGLGDQAGKSAKTLKITDLMRLRLPEFNHPALKPIITQLKLIEKRHNLKFEDLISLAQLVKNAHNAQITMKSNFLSGISNALTQAYLSIFKSLRDDEGFSTEGFDSDAETTDTALKAIIYRLRYNKDKGVSCKYSDLLKADTGAVLKKLDAGWVPAAERSENHSRASTDEGYESHPVSQSSSDTCLTTNSSRQPSPQAIQDSDFFRFFRHTAVAPIPQIHNNEEPERPTSSISTSWA